MAQAQAQALLLEEAIANDESSDLEQKLADYCASEGEITWRNNPLLIAVNGDKIKCVLEMSRLKPELGRVRNQDGSTAMHFICEKGNVAMVKAMVEVDPGLCLEPDMQQRIPLHIAVVQGNEEVLKLLVTVCPMSLGTWTCQGETAFHLALKNNHCSSFKLLMNELQKLKKEELLNYKDSDGNTVLHIATSRRQIEIIKLLLVSNKCASGFLQVNSTNWRGLTALDLLDQNISEGIYDKDISDLLVQAGAKQGHLLFNQPMITDEMVHKCTSSMKTSSFLAVFILFAAAAYSNLFSLNNVYSLEAHQVDIGSLKFKDMMKVPNPVLPDVFYFLVVNTIIFTVSLFVILVNTWSMVSNCSFCFRALPICVTLASFVNYALIVKQITPKFSLTIGSHNISSCWVVWSYGPPLILSIAIIWLIVKLILCIFSKFSKACS